MGEPCNHMAKCPLCRMEFNQDDAYLSWCSSQCWAWAQTLTGAELRNSIQPKWNKWVRFVQWRYGVNKVNPLVY